MALLDLQSYFDEESLYSVRSKINSNFSKLKTHVDIPEDIPVLGVTVGSYKDGDSISANIDLFTLLKNIFQTAIHPTYIQPTASISVDDNADVITNGASTFYIEVGYLLLQGASYIYWDFTKNDAGNDISRIIEIDGVVVSNLQSVDEGYGDDFEFEERTINLGNNIFKISIQYLDGPVLDNNLGVPDSTGQVLGGWAVKQVNIVGRYKMYWGLSTQSTLTDNGIISGLSSALSTSLTKVLNNYDCQGKYFYLVSPSSFGTPTIKVNGLTFTGYTIESREFTNAQGYTSTYNVLRFNTVQNGVLNIEIS